MPFKGILIGIFRTFLLQIFLELFDLSIIPDQWKDQQSFKSIFKQFFRSLIKSLA